MALYRDQLRDLRVAVRNSLEALGFEVEVINRAPPRYWIFQGNPKVWDVRRATYDFVQTTWSILQHKDEIEGGDRAFREDRIEFLGFEARGGSKSHAPTTRYLESSESSPHSIKVIDIHRGNTSGHDNIAPFVFCHLDGQRDISMR
jgi:hypothetical protein